MNLNMDEFEHHVSYMVVVSTILPFKATFTFVYIALGDGKLRCALEWPRNAPISYIVHVLVMATEWPREASSLQFC